METRLSPEAAGEDRGPRGGSLPSVGQEGATSRGRHHSIIIRIERFSRVEAGEPRSIEVIVARILYFVEVVCLMEGLFVFGRACACGGGWYLAALGVEYDVL